LGSLRSCCPCTIVFANRCNPLPDTPPPPRQNDSFEDTYAKWAELDLKDKTIDCPCKTQTRCIASIHQYPALDKNKKPITQNEVQAVSGRASVAL